MADGSPVVRLRQVTKWYGSLLALQEVDLLVEAGGVHGLLGPNGAGKTTLLRILLGLVRPDAGSVELFGRAVRAGQAPPAGVGGFVEAPRFYPYLSGRRNLQVLARLDGAPGQGVDEVLEQVGLTGRADERVGGWSLGARQRLGLAAALLRAPRLLVVDEPGNGLDPAAAADMRALLAGLAAAGRAVLLSSHDMAEVEQLCRTVTVLQQGAVAFDGPLAQLRARAPDPPAWLSTSDDPTAARVAGAVPGVVVDDAGHGLRVRATTERLDALVHALSRSGVAVRELRRERVPLQDLVAALGDDLVA